jgi:parvulin-like peptidyl-prolyl isomerase
VNRALLAAGALVLAVVASSCSSVEPNAATVNGTAIQRSDLEDQLKAYADNQPYTAYQAQQGSPITGEGGPETVTMDFTDSILRRQILLEIVRQEVVRRGLTVTPELQQEAKDQAKSFTTALEEPTASAVWQAFPTWFQNKAIEQTANYLTLNDALGGGTLDDAALQKLYDANPALFGGICARHILVASEDQAKALKAQLDAGADFAKLAAANSIDTATAQQGGQLYTAGQPCPAASTYDPDFVAGAFTVPEGKVTDPIHSQFGWHLIIRDKTEPPASFAAAKDAVQQYATAKANNALNDVLTQGAKGNISIARQFGTWEADGASIAGPTDAVVGTSTTSSPTTTTG